MSVLIKGGRIITAGDDYVGDVFVDGETISLIGASLDVAADKVIDASREVRAPGRDRPAHPPRDGLRRHDDLRRLHVGHRRRPRSAGRPRSSTSACRRRVTPFPEALANYHEKIDRCKPVIDVGFHIGVTDLEGGGGLEELAKLPDEGVTSYKLFMAYKGAVMVDDETLFRTMQVAQRHGRARDGARRERRRHRRDRQGGGRRGEDGADLARADAPAGDRGRGHEPRDPARARRRMPALRRPRLVQGGDRADRARAGEGLARLGRDVHAVPLRRRDARSKSRTARAAKYIYTPPPRPKEHQEHLWKALSTDDLSVVSTDHCPFNWHGQKATRQARLLEDPERRPRDREPPPHAAPLRRARAAASR